MTTDQLQEAILAKTKELPDELLREVYDFAEFLSERKNRTRSTMPEALLSAMNQSEAAHLEEEFSDYRNRYPYE